MPTRPIIAEKYFNSGFNCAQSVLSAYASSFNLDEELLQRISCGFGGGMGKLQETCGAVTGAIMVIGLHNSRLYNNNEERKTHSYNMVREYDSRFKALYGTNNCKSILKTDINSEEGYNHAVENKLFDTICTKCVTDSVEILGQIIPGK